MSDSGLITGLTVKAIKTLISKVESRLKHDLVRTYTTEYTGISQGDSRGMKILAELNQAKGELELVKPFAECLCAQPGSQTWSVGHFIRSYKALEQAGIEIAQVVEIFIITRAINEAFAEHDWDQYCINASSKMPEAGLPEGFESMTCLASLRGSASEAGRCTMKEFQESVCVQHVIDLMRPASEADANATIKILIAFVSKVRRQYTS